MRMLKKVLLAAGLVGLLGTVGFAKEAKAALEPAPVLEFTDDSVELTFDGDMSEEGTYKVRWTIGGETFTQNLEDDGTAIITGLCAQLNKNLENSTKALWSNTSTISTISAVILRGSSVISESGSCDMDTPLYKITATAGSLRVTMTDLDASSTPKTTKGYIFGYDGNQISILASISSMEGVEWLDTGSTDPYREEVVNGPADYVASVQFNKEGIDVIVESSNYYPRAKQDFTIKWRRIARPNTPTFDTTKNGTELTVYYENSTGVWEKVSQYTKLATSGKDSGSCAMKFEYIGNYMIVVEGLDSEGDIWRDAVEVYVQEAPLSTKVTTSNLTKYITIGGDYVLEFKAKPASGGEMSWYAESSDYVDSISMDTSSTSSSSSSSSSSTVSGSERYIRVKTKGSLDAAKETTIKLKCKVDGVEATIDSDTATTLDITGYSKVDASYNSSERTISYKVPAKVNTGTTDGKDSNYSSESKTVLDSVNGVRLQVFLGDTSLGVVRSELKDNGKEATISATTLERILASSDVKKKLTGTTDLKIRVFPCDGSSYFNKNIYKDVTARVYKVTVKSGTGETAKEYYFYGFEGQTIDTSTESALSKVTSFTDSTGANVARIVVNSNESRNVYTAVGAAGGGSSEEEGGAATPGKKGAYGTGQSTLFVYIMAILVIAAVATGLFVYNKKSKKSI